MHGYYSQKLSAERLRLCYDIAPPRVKQYLKAEIEFVLSRIKPEDHVLELGCGYGRVLQNLSRKAKTVVGIDISHSSLCLAQKILKNTHFHLLNMDAVELGFKDQRFNLVVCIQNGISAFKVNQRKLIKEAIRVTHSGRTVLFSSYSEKFWENRLEWFRLQAEQGLLGEIDEDASGNGVIVCKDGFTASTVGPDDFFSLSSGLDNDPEITEVDNSSIFCEIHVK